MAAAAINKLAENLKKQGKPDKAVSYFAQVAIDFRRANPNAARHAMGQTILYHVRTKPDEAKLREFYEKGEKGLILLLNPADLDRLQVTPEAGIFFFVFTFILGPFVHWFGSSLDRDLRFEVRLVVNISIQLRDIDHCRVIFRFGFRHTEVGHLEHHLQHR